EEMRDGLANAQEDPLFDAAVEIVLETKRGSVSMLQRRLAIGYTRAARLVEMMGEAGILGQHTGTAAREVAMSLEEWRALKEQAAADAAAAAEGQQGALFDEEADAGSSTAEPPFTPPNSDEEEELVDLDDAEDAYDDEEAEDEEYDEEGDEDAEYEDDEEYEEDEEELDDDQDEEEEEDEEAEDLDAASTPAKPPVHIRKDRRGVQN